MSVWRGLVIGVMSALATVGVAQAQEPAPPTVPPEPPISIPGEEEAVVEDVAGAPPVTLPLIPVPIGCTAPPMPHIVFVGTVIDRDYRTVRFTIERVRSGRADPFALGNEIDVRFGLDAQFLTDGVTYLVSAVPDADLGLLASRVSEPIEDFGGDEVIGISETDVNCPIYEDPLRTLHLDGTAIETSIVKPFMDAKIRILSAFLVPFGMAFGVIFLLAMFRLSLAAMFNDVVTSRSPRGAR